MAERGSLLPRVLAGIGEPGHDVRSTGWGTASGPIPNDMGGMRGAETFDRRRRGDEAHVCSAEIPRPGTWMGIDAGTHSERSSSWLPGHQTRTVPRLDRVICIYERAGFSRIPAYRHNPDAEAVFMELKVE